MIVVVVVCCDFGLRSVGFAVGVVWFGLLFAWCLLVGCLLFSYLVYCFPGCWILLFAVWICVAGLVFRLPLWNLPVMVCFL